LDWSTVELWRRDGTLAACQVRFWLGASQQTANDVLNLM